MGGKKDAPKDAAAIQAMAAREGLDELKRQFDISRGDIEPFRAAGARALAGREASSTLEGLSGNLSRIFQGLDPLVAERTDAVRGQLGATGLSRSGAGVQAIADIPTQLGLQIEQLLSGRQESLSNLGIGAATTSAGLGQQYGQNVLNTQTGIGQAQAQGILGSAQAQAGFTQGVGNLLGSFLALSDPRLKTNIVKVGQINDLGIYQWDWIPEVEGMMVADTSTLGFMADEVEEKYPEYVAEFGGFRCIAYAPLINLLEHNVDEYYDLAA